jgi:hydrogenase maturation protease HycI
MVLIDKQVIDTLGHTKKDKVLFITIGNTLRADDGVGPYIAEKLYEADIQADIIDAGQRPENVIDEAVALNPTKIIIIDAANFGGAIGEARIIPEDKISASTLSTHTFPIPVISSIIREDTGSDIFFIGIQPDSMQLGEAMNDKVIATANEIITIIKERY